MSNGKAAEVGSESGNEIDIKFAADISEAAASGAKKGTSIKPPSLLRFSKVKYASGTMTEKNKVQIPVTGHHRQKRAIQLSASERCEAQTAQASKQSYPSF